MELDSELICNCYWYLRLKVLMHKVRLDFKSPDIYHPDDFMFLFWLLHFISPFHLLILSSVSWKHLWMAQNSNILYSEYFFTVLPYATILVTFFPNIFGQFINDHDKITNNQQILLTTFIFLIQASTIKNNEI